MSQRVFDLSKLSEFLLNTLRSTEEVKNILQTQCGEAKFALAPWQLETIVQKELDDNSCACVGILSSEDHVKEIASGIENAVAQARNLREKLAINVLEEKKLARKPSVQQIYDPGLGEIGSRINSKLVESKLDKENGRINKPCNLLRSKIGTKQNEPRKVKQKKHSDDHCAGKNNSRISNAEGNKLDRIEAKDSEARGTSSKVKKILETKQIADKKLVAPSPYNSLVAASKDEKKLKKKKNFIAANKSSVKSIKAVKSTSRIEASINSIQTSESSAATKSSDSLISRAPSAAELGNLINKASLESDIFSTKSGCPIHDVNAPKFIEQKIYASFDVAEGLDRFGAPPELVKILKVYHNYLNGQLTSRPGDKRGENAACRFLEEFNTMNEARQKISTKEKLDNICKDFLPVFKDSFNKKLNFIELSKLKIRYTDLDSAFKSLQIRNCSPTKKKRDNQLAKNFYDDNKSWKLNSVWNEACIHSFEGMSRARCIKYMNRNQLSELFDCIQKFQQIKYQSDLTSLLIKEVIPLARSSLEPTSEEYANVYKMISTISTPLNMRVPVLVRTDE